ncbi:MAG: hypothetical protein KGH67_02020, partial [Candidatus Micrarchaeota archaeon]|nr:hypothetical protein [Candidatus Micrarchaeota archaeon]
STLMPRSHFDTISAMLRKNGDEGRLRVQKEGKIFDYEVIGFSGNYQDSIRELKFNHLRLLTYQEALVIFVNDLELTQRFKGKSFYISGEGLKKSGNYLVDSSGKISQLRRKPKLEEAQNIVYMWAGENPLSFDICLDEVVTTHHRRFAISGVDKPHQVLPIIIGIRKE